MDNFQFLGEREFCYNGKKVEEIQRSLSRVLYVHTLFVYIEMVAKHSG